MSKIIDSFHLPQSPEARERRLRRIYLPIGAVAATAVAFGGSYELAKARQPAFSPETVVHTVVSGDTEWGIAGEVEGSEDVDRRDIIQQMRDNPINAPAYSDGRLDPGEDVSVPIWVGEDPSQS